jgi:hypothetical protein
MYGGGIGLPDLFCDVVVGAVKLHLADGLPCTSAAAASTSAKAVATAAEITYCQDLETFV